MAGAGPEGYPDWQRERNVTGVLFRSAGPTTPTIPTELPESPIKESVNYLSMSRFRSIMGWLGITEQIARVEIESNRTTPRNTKLADTPPALTFFTSPSIGGPTPFCIPILAPYARILVTPEHEGTKYRLNMSAWGSDQVQPNLWLPPSTTLIPKTTKLIAAKSAMTLFPSNYYAGGVQVFIGNSQKVSTLVMEALTGFAEWVPIAQAEFTALNTVVFLTTPITAWRLTLFNFGAAEGELTLAVIPSYGNAT